MNDIPDLLLSLDLHDRNVRNCRCRAVQQKGFRSVHRNCRCMCSPDLCCFSHGHVFSSHERLCDLSLIKCQYDFYDSFLQLVFTFEGIGLIIPISESMKEPEKFPKVLTGVMIGITALFTSLGALSYATFGSETKTVILLNLPQQSHLVQTVQGLYSIAIMLSIPLQLFPAIRIMETCFFTKSGKYNLKVKWQKNTFRVLLLFVCAAIAIWAGDDLDKFVSIIGSVACKWCLFVLLVLRDFSLARFCLEMLNMVLVVCFGDV